MIPDAQESWPRRDGQDADRSLHPILGAPARVRNPARDDEHGQGAHRSAGGDRGSPARSGHGLDPRSEEHTSELQSLMRISFAVFCLKKKNTPTLPTYKEHHE